MGQPDILLADNIYFSLSNVKACADRTITPLIAMGQVSHHLPLYECLAVDAPAPQSDDPVVKMVHTLKTQQGRALYGKRKCTVEPVFGIIKQIMGFRQFSLGLQATVGEWKLVALAYNLNGCTCWRPDRPKYASNSRQFGLHGDPHQPLHLAGRPTKSGGPFYCSPGS